MPEYEKTPEGRLKVITPKEETHSLSGLINWKAELTAERDKLNDTIAGIDVLISEAQKLGVPETPTDSIEVNTGL